MALKKVKSLILKREGGMVPPSLFDKESCELVLVIWYEYLVHVNLCTQGIWMSQHSHEGG